jgi:tetratricopeptide (TPR) repeat protein
MQFGEVNLGSGGGDAGEALLSQRPQEATPSGAAMLSNEVGNVEEAALDAQARRAQRTVVVRKASKAPKIIAALLVVFIIGGASLALTPYGPFGSNVITDVLKKGTYVTFTEDSANAARKRFASDTFVEARKASDDLDLARKKMPRARQLSAYSALAEYMTQLRFGADPERGARAQVWLKDIPPGSEVAYLGLAKSAQQALVNDLAGARRGVDAATRNTKDPGQFEAAILRGEIELLAHDGAAAATAFKKASDSAPSARASYGLARAYFLTKDYAKTKEALGQVLAQSPQHAGALILRANLTWVTAHDDQAAMRDLATVIEGPAKQNAGVAELAQAYSSKGGILFARERAGDARKAFDEAVKLDARNVSALVGQAEILYAEQRYTEALSRFDTAVGADPSSIDAIVGHAKTNIALEHLQDAKQQLTAARAANPKEMRVALWLGKAEEALGNKTVAEKQFNDAIELADPSAPDAITAYVALATLLAGQGRPVEAQAKLDQARGKLPDSSALQRAIGEVAAAQGHYDEAISHYESALVKDPSDVATHFRLGVTLRRMRRMDQASAEFDKVLAADKDYPGLALERGLLFEESGEVQKALEQFKGAMQKAPTDLDLQLRVGAAYVAIGRPDDAIPLLKKVLEARQNSAEVNHYLGRAYLKKGGLEASSAMRYLKRAIELDPNRAEYHLYLGWAANDSPTPDFGLARAEVDAALKLDALLADGYWQRGDILRKGGAVDDAIADLKKALELRPNRIEAHASLAEAYEQKNNLPNNMSLAEREWAQAVAGDQERPEWRYKYGRLLHERGQSAAAVTHLSYSVTQGMSLSPRPAWVVQAEFVCAEAMKKTGRKQEAIEHYKTFADMAPPSNPDRADAIRAIKALGGTYEPTR